MKIERHEKGDKLEKFSDKFAINSLHLHSHMSLWYFLIFFFIPALNFENLFYIRWSNSYYLYFRKTKEWVCNQLAFQFNFARVTWSRIRAQINTYQQCNRISGPSWGGQQKDCLRVGIGSTWFNLSTIFLLQNRIGAPTMSTILNKFRICRSRQPWTHPGCGASSWLGENRCGGDSMWFWTHSGWLCCSDLALLWQLLLLSSEYSKEIAMHPSKG